MRVRRGWGNAGRRRPGVGLLLAGVILAGIGFAGTWSGTALASALVTGRQVKDGTLRSVDLRSDRAVTGADVRDGTLSAQKLSALPDGPAGPQGPQGLPGLDGLDNFDYEVPDPVSVSGFGEGEIFVPCREGIVVGGGASSFSNTTAWRSPVPCRTARVGRSSSTTTRRRPRTSMAGPCA